MKQIFGNYILYSLDSYKGVIYNGLMFRTQETTMKPTAEQIEALKKFAEANGRTWKSKLNHCWMRAYYGDYPGAAERSHILQGIRNEFGPSWLSSFRLSEVA